MLSHLLHVEQEKPSTTPPQFDINFSMAVKHFKSDKALVQHLSPQAENFSPVDGQSNNYCYADMCLLLLINH